MRRRFFAPEVIQTSAMDCGPAALKALFDGFGLYLSYGRLREACQTDVDGTSIDTLEAIAHQLGLDVAQLIMPADLLLLEESACLPAIVVVRLPQGATHFVVVWRVHGPLVQVMDPAAGRVWIPRRRLLDSLYIHEQPVPRAAWEEWSQTETFTKALRWRMQALGVEPALWADRAHLDASLRLTHTLRSCGKLKTRGEARDLLDLCARNPRQIPQELWAAREIAGDSEQLLMRGAVLIAASGPRKELPENLPESLATVRNEPPPRVWAPVWSAVRASGWIASGVVAVALAAAAAGTVFEALLFRGFFDLARHLKLSAERMAALAAMLAFLAALFALEWPAALDLLRLGRHLELRLRTRFLLKIPRLSDRYFQSRLISDMAFRAHTLQLLRELPELAGQFVRLAASLAVTAGAIAWFFPDALIPAALAAVASVAVPLLFQPAMIERDLRFREFSAGLSRFYLDALLGSRAIQAHGAARALRTEQAWQLGQWAEAGLRRQALLVRAEALQLALTLALGIGIVWRQAATASQPAALLLLVYWTISIPAIGRQFASFAWSLPALRNTLLRFLEPLGSPEEKPAESSPVPDRRGVSIEIDHVTAVAGGNVILDDLSLRTRPGEHIAVVGPSGAGKSSLAGLLLGWHKPSRGVVRVDDASLDVSQLAQLRRETAWIDPQVYLFNTTLFANLGYGNGSEADARIGRAIETAGLERVLERLPDGLQTPLGEGGALVSGGEGQSVRIGRALVRSGVRLAILDEPARGLDREGRRDFLVTARSHFAGCTLLCVTHDVTDTLDFDRVLVIEEGRIVQDGPPRRLYAESGSRYRELVDHERAVDRHMWSHPMWRRLRMAGGVVSESAEVGEWTSA